MTTRSEATLAACPLGRSVSHLRLEARRICDREGIDDPETLHKIYLSLVHSEYMQQIQPYIDAKAHFLALTIPQITIRLGEHAEIKYNLSESQNALVAEIAEAIANISEQYGRHNTNRLTPPISDTPIVTN